MSQTENIFGKIRGRFDDAAARRLDRSLTDKAIAAICAMSDEEIKVFISRFNRVFWHPGRGFKITRNGDHAS